MGGFDLFIYKMDTFFSSFGIAPIYIQAGLIVFLLFLLVLSFAQYRHHFIKGSMKGGVSGLVFGILFTLIVEGLLLVNGSTILTSVFRWDNAPKPLGTALDIGKEKLSNVLGSETNITTSKDVIQSLQSLNPEEIKKVRAIICEP